MKPNLMTRLLLVVALCSGLYLTEKAPVAIDSGGMGQPETVTQADQGGLTVRLKPGFDPDRPSQAEIDLLGTLLDEFLNRGGPKKNEEQSS